MFTTVRHAAVALTEDVFMLGLAEEADGTGSCLIFQEPVDPDLVDEIDTYCVTDEGHAVMYGGVREVSLRGSELTISLDPDMAFEAGLPSRFVLDLLISSGDRGQLADGLTRVLGYGREDEHPRMHL